MSALIQYLHVIGAFQGFLLAGLLIFGSQISTASRILGVWCLFLGLNFLGPFVYLDLELNAFSAMIGFHMFFPASYGAFLYLYCRYAIIDSRFNVKELWHFIPFILCYLLNIELYLSPPEVKLNAILYGPENLTSIMLAQIILTVQAFLYLGLSMILIRRYQTQAKRTLSNFNPDLFSWLWKLLLLDLVIWSLKAITVVTEHSDVISTIADVLIIVLIYSIALAQWRNPLLFKIAQMKPHASNFINDDDFAITSSDESPNIETDISDENDSSKKFSGALDPSTRTSVLNVVRQHMQEHESYLDNQLTLTSLAQAVEVSTHHLSEVLNQQEGKNFYQFVNEYRINFVCEKLKSDTKIKILDLAMRSGFSSKSTFNAVFKQFVKMTPSQYRQQLVQ